MRVVVCPHPPVLLREVGGADDETAELRGACREALEPVVAAEPGTVVVVGGAASLEVGRRLLDECGWTGSIQLLAVGEDSSDADLQRLATELRHRADVAVLLLGEGSARRRASAPGCLDERAFPFDDIVADALDSGESGELRSLDDALARDLLVSGRAVFRLLGWMGEPDRADLSYRDDPFGVSYFVATWELGPPPAGSSRRSDA